MYFKEYVAICLVICYQNVGQAYGEKVGSKTNLSYIDLRKDLDKILIKELQQDVIFNTGIGNREAVNLSAINEISYPFPGGVQQWYSSSSDGKLYLLGLTPNKLITLTGSTDKFGSSMKLSLNQTDTEIPAAPVLATMFNWWNLTTRRTEVICIVALNTTEKDIVWYRFENGRLEKFWSWRYYKPISYLKILEVGTEIKLALSSELEKSVDLYNINLGYSNSNPNLRISNNNYFVLSQTIHLQKSLKSLAISSIGDIVYMFVAQNGLNYVNIYETYIFTSQDQVANFRYFGNFTSSSVSDLTTFVIAHQNFIAIGGNDSTIYKIASNGLRINSLKKNPGPVKKWVVLNIHNYRDDKLLVAQKYDEKVEFYSWRGVDEGFRKLSICPCDIYNANEESSSICYSKNWAEKYADFLIGPSDSSFPCVLIPYNGKNSKLFHLKTHLQPQADPISLEINILNERKHFLQETWEKQKKNLKKLEDIQKRIELRRTLNEKNRTNDKYTSRPEELEKKLNVTSESGKIPMDEIIVKVKELNKTIENIKIEIAKKNDILERFNVFRKASGRIKVQGKTYIKNAEMTGKINGVSVNDLLYDTFRLDRPQKIYGKKTINTLKAKCIDFNKINNTSAEMLMYNDSPVYIKGNLTLKNKLTVEKNILLPTKGKVNNIDISRDFLQFDKHYSGSLNIENLQTSELFAETINGIKNISTPNSENVKTRKYNKIIAGNNLIVKNINTKNWKQTVDQLIWLTNNTNVKGTFIVNGKIEIKGDVFYNSSNYGVNDVDNYPSNVPSRGDVPFYNGYARDAGKRTKNQQEFEKSTTEANHQRRNIVDGCSKEAIYLEGPVIANNVEILGKLSTLEQNNGEWLNILAELIPRQASDIPTIITGKKTFSGGIEIKSPLKLSGRINDHDVSKFLTVDSNQIITGIKRFNAPIKIHNLTLNGTWNGGKLHENVKKNEKFNSSFRSHSFKSEENKYDFPKTQPDWYDVPVYYTKPKAIWSVSAPSIEVRDNIYIYRTINNLKISLYRVMIELQANSTVHGDVWLQNAIIRNLTTDVIGGYTQMSAEENCEGILKDGDKLTDLYIDELYVTGNVYTKSGIFTESMVGVDPYNETNKGYKIADIRKHAVDITVDDDEITPNFGNITFEDTVFFQSLNVLGHINDRFIDIYGIMKCVLKGIPQRIYGKKSFPHVTIKGDLKLDYLNDIPWKNILLTTGNRTIKGNVNMISNFNVEELDAYNFNGDNYTRFSHHSKIVGESWSWAGNLKIKENSSITYLETEKVDLINITEFYKDAIPLNSERIKIYGNKTFKNTVAINGKFTLTYYNSIDFNYTLDKMILFSAVNEINIPLEFDHLKISKLEVFNLYVPTSFFDLAMILEKGFRLDADRAENYGNISFNMITLDSAIQVKYIDGKHVDSLIRLNEFTKIDHGFQFENMTIIEYATVNGYVNKVLLNESYLQTFSAHKHGWWEIDAYQEIKSDVYFHKDFIISHGFLNTSSSYINDNMIKDVVTLRDNYIFPEQLGFECIKVNDFLKLNFINLTFVNTTEWFSKVLLKEVTKSTNIIGNWIVNGNITARKLVVYNYTGWINGINLPNLQNKFSNWMLNIDVKQAKLMEDYRDTCKNITSYKATSRNQTRQTKGLSMVQRIKANPYIQNFHFVKLQGEEDDYLFLGLEEYLKVLKWDKDAELYSHYFDEFGVTSFETLAWATFFNDTWVIFRRSNRKHLHEEFDLWLYMPTEIEFFHIGFLRESPTTDIPMPKGIKNDFQHVYRRTLGRDQFYLTKFPNGTYVSMFVRDGILYNGTGNANAFEEHKNYTENVNNTIIQKTVNPFTNYSATAITEKTIARKSVNIIKIYNEMGQLYQTIDAEMPNNLTWMPLKEEHSLIFVDNSNILKIYKEKDKVFQSFLSYSFDETTSISEIRTIFLPSLTKINKIPLIVLYTKSINGSTTISIIKPSMLGDPFYDMSKLKCDRYLV